MRKLDLNVMPLKYSYVPKGFLHCYQSACPKAAKCLRYKVSQYVPAERPAVTIVNPKLFSESEGCVLFKECRPKVRAYGLSRTLGSLAHPECKQMKLIIKNILERLIFIVCCV